MFFGIICVYVCIYVVECLLSAVVPLMKLKCKVFLVSISLLLKIFCCSAIRRNYEFDTCLHKNIDENQKKIHKLKKQNLQIEILKNVQNEKRKQRKKFRKKYTHEKIRSRQDSNLRSQRETDFQSVALTTRPRLLANTWRNILTNINIGFVLLIDVDRAEKP